MIQDFAIPLMHWAVRGWTLDEGLYPEGHPDAGQPSVRVGLTIVNPATGESVSNAVTLRSAAGQGQVASADRTRTAQSLLSVWAQEFERCRFVAERTGLPLEVIRKAIDYGLEIHDADCEYRRLRPVVEKPVAT